MGGIGCVNTYPLVPGFLHLCACVPWNIASLPHFFTFNILYIYIYIYIYIAHFDIEAGEETVDGFIPTIRH